MRICVISTSVFSVPCTGYSGLEHLAYLVAEGLAKKGHQVALVAPEGSSCPGVDMVYTGPAGQWDEKGPYGRYWEILPHFDAIIDMTWSKWSMVLKMEGKLNVPILGVMHAPVNTMYNTLPPGVDKPCFVCISQDQANHFMALHSREAKVCYNGIDLDFYKSMGIPRSDRFLFLARFSSIKAPDMAIRACKDAGVGLDLVGDTSITNEPDYFKQCQAMADGKQIRIVGPATRGETVWWFSQAHCLVHPTKNFREPFGLAPLEANACGCPVVGWDNGALRETIGDRGGIVVKSYDDLVKAIKEAKALQPLYMDGLRQKCVENASKFSLDRMISRYEELCIEAIQTGGW